VTSQRPVQGTFSTLLDREITQQIPIRPRQQNPNSTCGFIRQTTKLRTSDQVENCLLDSRHPALAQLESMPLHVNSGHVPPDENDCRIPVNQFNGGTMTRRRHNRDTDSPGNGSVYPSRTQAHQCNSSDSLIGGSYPQCRRFQVKQPVSPP
jgi:hypothetical protein